MSIIDDALHANQSYAAQFNRGGLAMPPAKKLAVLACMDARLDVAQILGLKAGDAHVIRNAGGIATEDAIRSLIISHHLLGTQEFMVINHTDCGMLTFKDHDLIERLKRETGAIGVVPAPFHSFTNLDQNVREQMMKLRAHPWLPKQVPIRGFVYDVKSGRLKEVATEQAKAHGG
ncbi:MAG: carbonic anhydrase [Bryobacteraceae bacterium]|jgi:carbonic anhydrase